MKCCGGVGNSGWGKFFKGACQYIANKTRTISLFWEKKIQKKYRTMESQKREEHNKVNTIFNKVKLRIEKGVRIYCRLQTK